jgi:hypothetical protein
MTIGLPQTSAFAPDLARAVPRSKFSKENRYLAGHKNSKTAV